MTLHLNLGIVDFDTSLTHYHNFDSNVDYYIDKIINHTQVAKIHALIIA